MRVKDAALDFIVIANTLILMLVVVYLVSPPPKVVEVEKPSKHFQCMVMCEAPREKYENSFLNPVREKVEKLCYAMCNVEYGKGITESDLEAGLNKARELSK